ncbi:MAG: hypothetical protein WAV76_07740, partial [Bacteroidota bacterium]
NALWLIVFKFQSFRILLRGIIFEFKFRIYTINVPSKNATGPINRCIQLSIDHSYCNLLNLSSANPIESIQINPNTRAGEKTSAPRGIVEAMIPAQIKKHIKATRDI